RIGPALRLAAEPQHVGLKGHHEFYSLKVRFFQITRTETLRLIVPAAGNNRQDKARNEKQAQFVG
ncbi:hypothetical protein, partial [Serratia marcescens]|uniref:hypothetical protein n=1 Tax=Serratia marcescens TaxID=615 RepID=UPI0019554369